MLDVRTPDGFTPLYLACKEGDIAAVSSLLKTNANQFVERTQLSYAINDCYNRGP